MIKLISEYFDSSAWGTHLLVAASLRFGVTVDALYRNGAIRRAVNYLDG